MCYVTRAEEGVTKLLDHHKRRTAMNLCRPTSARVGWQNRQPEHGERSEVTEDSSHTRRCSAGMYHTQVPKTRSGVAFRRRWNLYCETGFVFQADASEETEHPDDKVLLGFARLIKTIRWMKNPSSLTSATYSWIRLSFNLIGVRPSFDTRQEFVPADLSWRFWRFAGDELLVVELSDGLQSFWDI